MMLSWKGVEILTRVKKKGNHINLETSHLKGCGHSMTCLNKYCLAYCRLSTANI